MRVIYTSKGMSKKFGVRVIYRKIRYLKTPAFNQDFPFPSVLVQYLIHSSLPHLCFIYWKNITETRRDVLESTLRLVTFILSSLFNAHYAKPVTGRISPIPPPSASPSFHTKVTFLPFTALSNGPCNVHMQNPLSVFHCQPQTPPPPNPPHMRRHISATQLTVSVRDR